MFFHIRFSYCIYDDKGNEKITDIQPIQYFYIPAKAQQKTVRISAFPIENPDSSILKTKQLSRTNLIGLL